MSPQLTFWAFPTCAFVFIFLNTFLALTRQDFKQEICYKLYLCLSLVLLPGELDTHLHLTVNITPIQPGAQRPT